LKYTEFHRIIKKNKWRFLYAEGSHYFYEKDGKISPPVPYHGAKEIGEGLKRKLINELGLQ
jgi:mRNA interferase HicA